MTRGPVHISQFRLDPMIDHDVDVIEKCSHEADARLVVQVAGCTLR